MARKIFDISSLSSRDYINLVANYYALLTNESDEEKSLKERGFKKAYIETILKKKKRKSNEILGLRFTKPLLKFKYPYLSLALTYFENYERGNLPFNGSVSEQPAQIMEVFSTIRAIRFEYQKQQEKQNALNSKRK